MAFTVGELLAKLKMDTREFDAGVKQAEAGIAKVSQAAAKADRTVGMSERAIRAYTGATRLSTSEISAAAAAYDGHTRAAIYNTRSVVLAHVKALEMNAAFDAGAGATRRSVAGLARLNDGLRVVAMQMAGVNPVAGRLLGTIGQFAVGTGVMVGVFAGMAALAALWRKLGEDAREAEEKLQSAINTIQERAAADLVAAQGGPAAAAKLEVERELNDVLRDQATARERVAEAEARFAAVAGAPAREGIDLENRAILELAAAKEDLQKLEEEGLRLGFLVSQAGIQAAADAEKAAEKTVAATNREIAAMQKLADAAVEALGPFMALHTNIGRPGVLQGRGMDLPTAFGTRSMGVDRSDKARKSIVDSAIAMQKNFTLHLEKSSSGLKRFGEGVKSAGEGLFDMGALGANLASQGIGLFVSRAISIAGALFGGKDQGEALKANTAAIVHNTEALLGRLRGAAGGELSRLTGFFKAIQAEIAATGGVDLGARLAEFGLKGEDVNRLMAELGLTFSLTAENIALIIAALEKDPFEGFLGQVDLLRRKFGLLDISDPIAQFGMLLDVFTSSLPTGGALSGLFAGVDVSNIGDRVGEILDAVLADPSLLGGMSLDAFIDFLSDMESLGDAAGDAAGELGALAGTVRNAPSGYRANFARYGAETPTEMGGGTDNSVTVEGDVIIVTDDPEEFGHRLRREAQRGGTSNFQLATRPSGSFRRVGSNPGAV